jgi:hypothetical protein
MVPSMESRASFRSEKGLSVINYIIAWTVREKTAKKQERKKGNFKGRLQPQEKFPTAVNIRIKEITPKMDHQRVRKARTSWCHEENKKAFLLIHRSDWKPVRFLVFFGLFMLKNGPNRVQLGKPNSVNKSEE